MKKHVVKLSEKQQEAWKLMKDVVTNEIMYGGGAGGGKSWLGCLWSIDMCMKYPGCRGLMARAQLKALKESTLKTFEGLIRDLQWQGIVKVNMMDGHIRFNNGSEIIMKDLFAYPSDPNFDSLGSTEYTFAFIDEASQVTEKAKNIVLSRIRYKLEEFGIVPKLLITSNPAKNWMYDQFYKPFKNHKLGGDRAFVQSLVTDNPFISPHYIKSLHKLDELSKQRLLYGNWEYDDTLGKLFKYDNILNIYTNTFVPQGEKYLTCDVARKGSDKAVIMLWNGLRVEKIITYDISLTRQIKETILELSEKHSVPRNHIVVDEDGVGGGVVDELPGCVGFVNGSRAKGGENYRNLKSQCYFKLAEFVGRDEVYVDCPDVDMKASLIQDLEQQSMKDPDKDGKLGIVGKDIIKMNIGRSPDFSDALMMRMYFEVGVQELYEVAEGIDFDF